MQLAYNGAAYHGWQIQQNSITVQEVIEKGLSILIGSEVSVLGCGRTDSGVHASYFVAHFWCNTLFDSLALCSKLNKYLKEDIIVFSINKITDDFHARFSATQRSYKYYVSLGKNPFLKEFACNIYTPLDIDAMNNAANLFIGKKDFTSFSKLHTDTNNNICDLISAKWQTHNNLLVFQVSANRFLRNMVRAMVGTLIEVGKHKINVEDINTILADKNRSSAGQSMPANALFLTDIKYPKSFGIIKPKTFSF